MIRRTALKSLWVVPVVSVVHLPCHAQISAPMASLLTEESGSTAGCYEDEDAHLAPSVFDSYTLENLSIATEIRIANFRVGNSSVWNVKVEPFTIPAQNNLHISRGFQLPASEPLDYSGSKIDITFVDGSVLTIPAINC